MNIGVYLRNLLAWALCVCAAAGLVVPAGYVVVKNVINEQVGQPALYSPPIGGTLIALGICAGVTVGILIIGAFVIKLTSLWTASAILMAFPALHLATKLIREHLSSKFLEAWQPLVTVPDWGWWTMFGISLAFYLFCGAKSQEPVTVEPLPEPPPAKKK